MTIPTDYHVALIQLLMLRFIRALVFLTVNFGSTIHTGLRFHRYKTLHFLKFITIHTSYFRRCNQNTFQTLVTSQLRKAVPQKRQN